MNQLRMSWNHPQLHQHYFGAHKGAGVIAQTKLKRGTTLSLFGGYVMSIAQYHELPKDFQEYTCQIADKFMYGCVARRQLSVSDYFNHSCNPNAGFRDSITLVAMRTIQKGEEVTFDYCMCSSALLRFKCACEAAQCRKIIRSNDWRKPELQARYAGYFVPYINDKIARLK